MHELDWLKENYGLDPNSLNGELQRLAQDLGPDGVSKLVKKGARKLHRGEDPVSVAEKLSRIQETGGLDKWTSVGARKVKGDKPQDWLKDEQLQVGKEMFNED